MLCLVDGMEIYPKISYENHENKYSISFYYDSNIDFFFFLGFQISILYIVKVELFLLDQIVLVSSNSCI
jgi:hypothetical protein